MPEINAAGAGLANLVKSPPRQNTAADPEAFEQALASAQPNPQASITPEPADPASDPQPQAAVETVRQTGELQDAPGAPRLEQPKPPAATANLTDAGLLLANAVAPVGEDDQSAPILPTLDAPDDPDLTSLLLPVQPLSDESDEPDPPDLTQYQTPAELPMPVMPVEMSMPQAPEQGAPNAAPATAHPSLSQAVFADWPDQATPPSGPQPFTAGMPLRAAPLGVAQGEEAPIQLQRPEWQLVDQPPAVAEEPALPKLELPRTTLPPASPTGHIQLVSLEKAAQPAAALLRPAEESFVDNNHPNIVTALRSQLTPDGGSVRIRLDPPELGALNIQIVIRDGIVSASFQTSNDEATRLVGHSLGQLKHTLETQGVIVDKLHVQQAPRDNPSGNAGEDAQQQHSQDRSQQQHEQQRREMLHRMWRKVMGGDDAVDVMA